MAEVWTPPDFDAIATDDLVTAAYLDQLGNSLRFLKRVALATFTAPVSVTHTTVGTADQIVSAGAITYENVPHRIEFFCPNYAAPAVATFVILRDGTTVEGTLGRIPPSTGGFVSLSYPITPTAASHTYNIAAWLAGAGTGTMNAGTGGTAGDATTYLNGYLRITREPT